MLILRNNEVGKVESALRTRGQVNEMLGALGKPGQHEELSGLSKETIKMLKEGMLNVKADTTDVLNGIF